MADDDSFIILGTSSPAFSLEAEIVDSNSNSIQIICANSKTVDNSMQNSLKCSHDEQKSSLENATNIQLQSIPEVSMNSLSNEHNSANTKITSSIHSVIDGTHSVFNTLGARALDSFAAYMNLNETAVRIPMTSVYSQYPSQYSIEAPAEDVIQTQNFMTEHLELKNALAENNNTLKKFINDMHQTRQQYEQQLTTLRNENQELKREINLKNIELKSADIRKNECDKMSKVISEKSTIIENMRTQITELEQQRLIDAKANAEIEIDREEHKQIVTDLERQINELSAKNLDLTNMQKNYIEEITILKFNRNEVEDIKKEIDLLNDENDKKSEILLKFKAERDEIKGELIILRQELEAYVRDYEIKRNACETLISEKDQLLQDLSAVQSKNQELIEAQEKHENHMKQQQCLKAFSPSGKRFELNINQRPIRVCMLLPEPYSTKTRKSES